MIHFYIHPYFWPCAQIPDTADINWPCFAHGIYAWTIQTWLRLSGAGFPCTLTRELPNEGIVVAHRERAKHYAPERLVEAWLEIFSKVVLPEYARWRRTTGLSRSLSIARHVAGLQAARAKGWIARRMIRTAA